DNAESFEKRAAALAKLGVRLGLQYDNNWTRPSLQHPNLSFFSHTLPEWHAPLYRSLSLTAQRFARLPNFAGIDIGSDNAGYVSFWHWAPPIPDRPWGEAMIEFTGSAQPRMARAPSHGPRELSFEQPVATQAEFIKYVERYENAFRQYGYFAEAVREVDTQLVFTTGSFGSAPGTGGRGGWPWASLPGRVIAEGLTTQQAYDWNETHAAKPLHNVALIDRLRSYHPQKRTWALLDNFQFLHGREAWQRACALALTRGVQGLGTNFLASPAGEMARPDVVAFQTEMNAWMHKYGGVYARTEPLPTIGVFYGHHQAVQRRVFSGANPTPEQLLRGSHEGKVAEALFLCHAAGWPARVITFQELMRGTLPVSMKAILLVGLDRPDETWAWSHGLEPALQQLLDRGGRIIADEESVSPVPVTRPGLQVAAYIQQSHLDATPQLFARNTGNISRLREAMADVPRPIAASDDPLLWAIPTECGDTQFVTAINQAFAEGDEAQEMLRPADPKATKPEVWKTKGNASLFVKPRSARLGWNTERPIYDVRLGRKLSGEEASQVDFTRDGFQWFALPSREVVEPQITISAGVSGFFEAKPQMSSGGVTMSGVPVEITVRGGGESATLYSATGRTVRLPAKRQQQPMEYEVTVTELLSGLKTIVSLHESPLPSSRMPPENPVRVRDRAALARFAARKHVALAIALTPEQHRNSMIVAQANSLREHYQKEGRIIGELATAWAGGVVTSLQPLRSPHRFPQWQTIAADLVLFGTPANNVLLMDQARGQLFPTSFKPGPSGCAELLYTRSPFVGEY
ncbi:MAG TPA: hypothetical protein VGO90_16805, partial [Chthoniobacteraceae bacterium]|nr:hypothetical protein [Chthoniobacteraceae bacterium]